MECLASEGPLKNYPRSLGSTSFRREAGGRQGLPSAQVGEGWVSKPPNLVRHHPNPTPALWGEGWHGGAMQACSLPPHPGSWPVLSCPGDQGTSWEPHSPQCSQQSRPGIRINESYSWFKCCLQPGVGISALVLPLPQ